MTVIHTAVNTDVLGKSHVLRKSPITKREEFDPENSEHLKSVRNFLSTGNWGSVQFYAELPYLNVPETVFRRLADAALKNAGF